MAAAVGLSVLGPLLARRAGSLVAVPGGLATMVLVSLAVAGSRGVSDDQLLERLWTWPAPKQARASLRNTVSRLRKLLGEDVIVRTSRGYALDHRAVKVDLADLQRFADTARTAMAGGDYTAARRVLDAALALRRGPVLIDIADEEWAVPEVRYWNELVEEVGDRWIETAAASGDAGAAARALELTLEHPEREVRWLQLARLLAATGRRIEALRALRQARRALGEFGVDPGPALVDLEHQLLEDGPDPMPARHPNRAADPR